SFVIDRGEQVHTLEAAKALLAAQVAAFPPPFEEVYEDDEPFEVEAEVETEETEGLTEEQMASDGAEGESEGDADGRKRKRRRRSPSRRSGGWARRIDRRRIGTDLGSGGDRGGGRPRWRCTRTVSSGAAAPAGAATRAGIAGRNAARR